MLIISLDPSIQIAHFGCALLDTSIHQDPYRCVVQVEQPEAYRKREKITVPSDKTGHFRAELLADWIEDLIISLETPTGVVLLTESNVGKASWSNEIGAKLGRSKSMSLNQRANDYVCSVAHSMYVNVIELNPTDFSKTKIQRSQDLDMIIGIDRMPRNPHYDDCLHRAIQWWSQERLRQR